MKSKVLIFILSTILIFTASSCSTNKTDSNIVEITYWQFWTGFEEKAINDLVKKFNLEHKNIKVKMLTISEPWKKTLLSIIGGTPPDVINTTSEWLPELAVRNALLPLDDYCKEQGLSKKDFIPVYWEMLSYNNMIWGIPLTPSSTAIFWNKDLFKEAGLDPEKPPRTPREWEEYAYKLTKRNKSGKIVQSGFFPSWPSWAASFYPLLFNGSWGDNEKGTITANHPGNIEGWNWAQSFAKKLGVKNVQSFQEEFGNIQGPNNPFYSGKIAFEINGVWEGNFISRFAPHLNWGAAVARTVDGKPTTSVICTPIAIPRGAKHPKEAFYFISWLLKQENSEELCIKQKKFSPLIASDNEDFVKKHPNPYIKVFIDAAKSENASYFPATTAFQLYKRELRNGFSKVMRLEGSPQEVLDSVQKKLDVEIKRQKKYELKRASAN